MNLEIFTSWCRLLCRKLSSSMAVLLHLPNTTEQELTSQPREMHMTSLADLSPEFQTNLIGLRRLIGLAGPFPEISDSLNKTDLAALIIMTETSETIKINNSLLKTAQESTVNSSSLLQHHSMESSTTYYSRLTILDISLKYAY